MIYLNGSPINVTMFPDNTSQVWKLPENTLNTTNYANITWDFQHEGEFIHLAQLKHLLDYNGFTTTLRLKYLPYGRQDKLVSNNTTFALHSFAKLLNSLKFDEIIINDPHSIVALEIINNSKAIYPIEEVMKIAYRMEADLFCYPDNGAITKYTGYNPETDESDVQKEVYDYPCMYGEKVRDQLTGQIIHYSFAGDVKDKKILIVDDICDGGMTFKLLTKELLKSGAKEVNLFVSHGIFSKGIKTLHDSGIKRIFTTDGEISEVQNNITYRKL